MKYLLIFKTDQQVLTFTIFKYLVPLEINTIS